MYFKLAILSIAWIFHLSAVDFVLFTEPKTATHLLKPILFELTGKEPYCPRQYVKESYWTNKNFRDFLYFEMGTPCPMQIVEEIWQTNKKQGSFLHFHTPYTSEMEAYLMKKRCIVFFVIRDPRDQIVSLLNHYKKYGFLDKRVEEIESDDERLMYMIRHKMKNLLKNYKGWLTSPICCTLDFNKLMGSHGGVATDEDALDEMRKLRSALDLNVTDSKLQEVYENHFGKSGAFFRGKAGSWKDYFSEEHKTAVKEEIGYELIELDYEQNFDW